MLGIARHELADHWRRVYAKKVIRALPFGEEILKTQATSEKPQEIHELLQRLPVEIAELLQMKYVDGSSVKELALQFGVSVAAMQSKLYRAKELFKAEYERTKVLE
jgi:RNA polymerase sigma-70 factor (ECF subfamily)